MQTIWFPTPVFVLFRRLVNVVSSLSISQHYLMPKTAQDEPKSDTWNKFKALTWLSWSAENGAGNISVGSLEGDMHFPEPPKRTQPQFRSRPTHERPRDIIHKLMQSPVLYEPVRKPRNPVVLCHGLYGFDVRGPETFPMLRHHYWSNVLTILREKVGAEVIVTSVPGTGSVTSRARKLHEILRERAAGRSINFMAHSMGGLDCRHLITHIKPKEYTPASLTTIATPHRGSPFMDWCTDNIGIGKLQQKEKELAALVGKVTEQESREPHPSDSSNSGFSLSLSSLPSSFTTLLLSLLDSPAYANLSTAYLTHVFNPATPNDPNVRYFSVAGRISSMSVWHPLWLPKMVLDGFEERERQRYGEWEYDERGEKWGNDGLVTVQSARWGEFLGILEECDHWELRGARGIELDIWGSSTSGKDERAASASEESESGWNLGDWGRLVRAWKREERKAKGAGAAVSERQEAQDERERVGRGGDAEKARLLDESAERREKDAGFADEVVKASTEKLSAVFDWIVDQVPSIPPGSSPASGSTSVEESEKKVQESEKEVKSELATKQDLERFYVALCRKLYDEGL